MSVLVITGSARQQSHTRRLGEQLAAASPGAVLAPRLTELPYFDQDLEGTPPGTVQQLRQQVLAADTVVFVTPEYNGTIPGLLANAIDWLSRPYDGQPSVLRGKPVVTVAASPGGVGGVRALVSLRTVLGNAGAQLLEGRLSVSEVHVRLDDETLAAELDALVAGFSAEPARAA
ncbi:MAG: NADPH-dependent reductase [Frankiales bacterium]|jgi:chromate reductase|nr:NADPH-dependent reductase [Frankiales bacterium]